MLPHPLGPGAAGRAPPEAGRCFLAGGSSSSDELSRVRSITSTFLLPSGGVLPSGLTVYTEGAAEAKG